MKSSVKLHLPKGRDKGIQLAMIGLMTIGLIMSVSATMTTGVELSTLAITFLKQLVFLIAGYIGYALFSRYFSLSGLHDWIFPLLILSVLFLLATLFFPEVNGARAWIKLSVPGLEVTLQPSEFVKVVVVVMLASYLGNKQTSAKLNQLLLIPLFFIGTFFLIIAVLQSDLGSALVLAIMAVLVFLLASHPALAPFQWIAFIGMVVVLVAVGFLLTEGGLAFLKNLNILKDYQLARFENTVDPFINRFGTGYQLVSSLMAFVKGKWLGVGPGMGLQKYGYLPAAQTDFILAVIAEEIGFLGVMVVAGLTLFIVITLLRYAFKSPTDQPRMILAGVAYYLLIHFIFNVGGVTAILPLTGVPLLLISSGGSSTLAVMMALGIAQRTIIDLKSQLIEQKTEPEEAS